MKVLGGTETSSHCCWGGWNGAVTLSLPSDNVRSVLLQNVLPLDHQLHKVWSFQEVRKVSTVAYGGIGMHAYPPRLPRVLLFEVEEV